MTIVTLLRSTSFFAALASLPAFATEQIQVNGTCAIYGTRIAGPYSGVLEVIIDKSGRPRRIGALTLTSEGMEARAKSLSAFGDDFNRFGASQMQTPYDVSIVSADPQQGSSITAYGNGRLNEANRTEVPMWCTLTAL